MSAEKQIPVGTMCAMFGLNPNTVRTWERRYAFPSPVRGAGGHRTYSHADIELIARIISLINNGASPGDAIAQARETQPKSSAAKKTKRPHPPFYAEMLAAVTAHDQTLLRSLMGKAMQQLRYKPLIEDLAFPLLNQLGHEWETSGKGVAAEHSFSMLVETVILQQSQSISVAPSAPVITFACVPGEMHQIPLLHLANLVAEQGIARALVLAAGLPIKEILSASKRAASQIILLAATIPPSSVETRTWMKECVDAGWGNKIILAGPGFTRTRVYVDYPVRAVVGSFTQTSDFIASILSQSGK